MSLGELQAVQHNWILEDKGKVDESQKKNRGKGIKRKYEFMKEEFHAEIPNLATWQTSLT